MTIQSRAHTTCDLKLERQNSLAPLHRHSQDFLLGVHFFCKKVDIGGYVTLTHRPCDVEECRWMISPTALCSEAEILRSWMTCNGHRRLHVQPFLVQYSGADLRSGHLCSGQRGPCHMVFVGTWWKSMKKFALQLPKQDFYSFKLCTVDKVHAVRPMDNNNDMPFPSHKFNSLNVLGKCTHSATLTKTHPLMTRQKWRHLISLVNKFGFWSRPVEPTEKWRPSWSVADEAL